MADLRNRASVCPQLVALLLIPSKDLDGLSKAQVEANARRHDRAASGLLELPFQPARGALVMLPGGRRDGSVIFREIRSVVRVVDESPILALDDGRVCRAERDLCDVDFCDLSPIVVSKALCELCAHYGDSGSRLPTRESAARVALHLAILKRSFWRHADSEGSDLGPDLEVEKRMAERSSICAMQIPEFDAVQHRHAVDLHRAAPKIRRKRGRGRGRAHRRSLRLPERVAQRRAPYFALESPLCRVDQL